MRISIAGTLQPVLSDMRHVRRKIVPGAASKALNRISRKEVETPAVKGLADKKQVTNAIVRWHHTAQGQRTKRRRLRRNNARKDRLFVGWRWSTRSGEAGHVSVISLPGRTQNRAGVKAGRKGPTIKSAFIETSKKGQLGAWQRLTRSRYPIRFLRVDLTSTADAMFAKRVNGSGPAYEREYARILEVDLRKNRRAMIRRVTRGLLR